MNKISREQLKSYIARSSEGDREAFREIYEHLNDILFRYILARTTSRSDSLDLLQEVFTDLWKALKKFSYRSQGQFYGFVFRITKRKLAKYYESKKPTVELSETIVDEKYETETKRKIDLNLLSGGISRLSEKYRDVIELRYWSGLSFKEIAFLTKSKEATTKVQHHRALKQLEKILNENDR